ncbi:MAG: helix-turn-helix domain-containing protein [Thermodesulfobacteriota bacterium]
MESSPVQNGHDQEKQRILDALLHHNWHKTNTAQELGMNRSTLWRKMKQYGLKT